MVGLLALVSVKLLFFQGQADTPKREEKETEYALNNLD
jgi:hypothetical protein